MQTHTKIPNLQWGLNPVTLPIPSEYVRPSVRPFVRLSLCPLPVSGIHPMGERTAMLHKNLSEGGERVKIRDQPINTRNLVSLLSGKS